MRYFLMRSDVGVPSRWFLGLPVDRNGAEIDPWTLFCATSIPNEGPYEIPVRVPGVPLDLTFAALSILVVSSSVAAVLKPLAGNDVQFLPAKIRGHPGDFQLVNVLSAFDCVNESLSEIEYWKDPAQPEKMGTYTTFTKLVLRESEIASSHIFHLIKWHLYPVVSEVVREAIINHGWIGTAFRNLPDLYGDPE